MRQAERARMAMIHAAHQVPIARSVLRADPASFSAELPVVDNEQFLRRKFAYPILTKRARCPRCDEYFALTQKRDLVSGHFLIRKHDCRPPRPLMAYAAPF